MDFGLTEEQAALRESVIGFARRYLNDDMVNRDRAHSFSRDAWTRCGEIGLHGLPVPQTYGGSGADPVTIAVALEALGYASEDNGLIFSLNAQMWSCSLPLVRFGTEDQKRQYLPALCAGTLIGVHGMTEPGAGSDAMRITTRATPTGDGWVLDGGKTFITNAPLAGLFIVFATTDPDKGFAGLSAFLVERDTPGLSVGKPFDKMGLRTSPMSELFFDGCAIGSDAMIGTPGSGLAMFNTAMDWERGFILASAVGTMQRQLETCIAYARQRRQFGQTIGSFQSVSNRIVDMKLRLETARLLLHHMAWRKSQGRSTATESALVKLHLSESYLASSLDAVQIHGGYGYMTDAGIEREVRDAVGSRIYSGTSEIQRLVVARRLGL